MIENSILRINKTGKKLMFLNLLFHPLQLVELAIHVDLMQSILTENMVHLVRQMLIIFVELQMDLVNL